MKKRIITDNMVQYTDVQMMLGQIRCAAVVVLNGHKKPEYLYDAISKYMAQIQPGGEKCYSLSECVQMQADIIKSFVDEKNHRELLEAKREIDARHNK